MEEVVVIILLALGFMAGVLVVIAMLAVPAAVSQGLVGLATRVPGPLERWVRVWQQRERTASS